MEPAQCNHEKPQARARSRERTFCETAQAARSTTRCVVTEWEHVATAYAAAV